MPGCVVPRSERPHAPSSRRATGEDARDIDIGAGSLARTLALPYLFARVRSCTAQGRRQRHRDSEVEVCRELSELRRTERISGR